MSKKVFRKLTHDRFFKLNMHNLDVARDMLKELLPSAYLKQINLSTLALYPTEHLQAFSQKQTLADVVYSVKLQNGKAGLVYLHIEAQSHSDPIMPLRMIEMMVALQRQHWENHGRALPLPLVLPCIVYNGQGRYSLSTNWLDCFDESQQSLMVEMLTTPMPLINLSEIPDSDLAKHARAALMYYAFKHIWDKGWGEVLQGSVLMLKELQSAHDLDETELFTLFEFVLRYLADNSEPVPAIDEIESSLTELVDSLPGLLGETVMTVREVLINKGFQQGDERGFQRGIEQGVQQGIEQGIERGVQQGICRVAVNMLQSGVADEQVCQFTGISMDELDAIKQEQCETVNTP